MKDIRKIFNIKKTKSKDKSLFNIWEVIIIALAIGILSSVVVGYSVYKYMTITNEDYRELNDVIETYNKIKNEYFEDVSNSELADAAIDGMLNYLDERYSEYLDDESSKDLSDRLKGTYKGIGVLLKQLENNKIVVEEIYKGTPAEKSGLQVGDQVLAINDFVVKSDSDINEITAIIKEEDKETNLVVLREKEKLQFKIEVKSIETPLLKEVFERNNKKIGYIDLDAFTATSVSQFKIALLDLETQGIDSLVIDLRTNTGGYLNSAKDIASMFLKKGKIIYSLESKNSREVVYDKTREERDYPIVVLVNEATASASEILASSLKESYGALLVGMKTYGKGRVQQTSKLSDNSMIKYTTAKWCTPSGESIDGIGITPGISIQTTEKYLESHAFEDDVQLHKVLEVLSNNNMS